MDVNQKEYRRDGVTRVALPSLGALFTLREELTRKLQLYFDSPRLRLENLHKYISDEQREETAWMISKYFWDKDFCRKIVAENYKTLIGFVGPDIYFQTRPFLRIARPKTEADNIGFHRDTLYGQSPYEVSVHVPLTKLDKHSCLRFWKGSHVRPDEDFAKIAITADASEKGSRKHEMGFPYAPQTFEENTALVPIPLKIGEAAVFPPSTIHGQKINEGNKTRVSFDFRIVSKYAPVKFRTDLSSRGYSALFSSAVSEVAEEFLSQSVD